MRVLLLGCGRDRSRKVILRDGKIDFTDDDLVTVDIDPSAKPDHLLDIEPIVTGEKLPFDDGWFDEIHAYDVLEHIGQQGDWRGFFTEFKEYHRLLKPGGKFFILVPVGEDAKSDPGHRRFFHYTHFFFLSQKKYDEGVTNGTMTDYRWFWKNDFEVDFLEVIKNHHIAVILRRV